MPSNAQHAISRLWKKAGNNPITAGIVATVVGSLLVVCLLALGKTVSSLVASQNHQAIAATSGKSPLRATVKAEPLQFFDVAFDHDIGMPASSAGWANLHARGGVDNVGSLLELTLANRSTAPLTVTNIEAVVRKSWPAPAAWVGSQSSQGGNGLTRFSAWLTSAATGAGIPVSLSGSGEGKLNGPPYFETHYVSLRPGEIYQAAISIVNTVEDRELEYNFAISGNTATNPFTVTTVPGLLITHRPIPSYAHRYVHVSGRGNSEDCWVPETPNQGIFHCPGPH